MCGQVLFRVGLYAGGALAAKRALAPYAQPAARSLAAYCGLVPVGDEEEAAAEKERLAAAGAVLESKTDELASSLEDVKALLRRVERDVARTPGTPAGGGAMAAEVSSATVQALTPAIKDALRDIRDELRAEMRAMSERMQVAAAAPSAAATPARGQEDWRSGDGESAASGGASRQLHHPGPPGLARSIAPRDAGYSPGYRSSWEAASGAAAPGASPSPAGPGVPARSPVPVPHRGSRDNVDGGGPSNGSSSTGVGAAPPRGVAGAAASGNGDAPVVGLHPASYLSLLDMVESGRTPPGIREVDDKAPDNEAAPTAPTMRPPTKPWERGSAAGVPHYSHQAAAATRPGVVLTELPGEWGGYGSPSAGGGGAGPSSGSASGWTPPPVPAFVDTAAARALGVQPGVGAAAVEQADA